MSGRILVVDDDPHLTSTLELGLGQRGFAVRTASSPTQALEVLDADDVDVVLTDLNMPGLGGIEFCARIAEHHPDLPVIVLTAFGSFESAVAAIRAGAYDFLSKPAKLDAIVIAVERAVAHSALRREVRRLRLESAHGPKLEGVIAQSEAMKRVLDLISRVASTPASVLITGESGTGKEVVAHVLHQLSQRRGPFVAINCAAMPATLLESELFGHARGAFTDAHEARIGLLTEAHGGTLLLDEIGDMPLDLQPKLLRVLQERRVRPLGAKSEHPVDIRFVAATNRDLEDLVEQGRFREDLFFRINVVHVALAPLRERTADILPLAQRFLREFAERSGKEVHGISATAAEKLLHHDWLGNVRELQNCMERAVALTRYSEIGVDDLPDKLLRASNSKVLVATDSPSDFVTLDELERRYVLHVLETVGGNKSVAARILGIERKTLYRKLEAWGLSEKSAPPTS